MKNTELKLKQDGAVILCGVETHHTQGSHYDQGSTHSSFHRGAVAFVYALSAQRDLDVIWNVGAFRQVCSALCRQQHDASPNHYADLLPSCV
jgi:hypothetical protein